MIQLFLFLQQCAGDVLVTIPDGTLKGSTEHARNNIPFYAFQMIPFAKPPVGNLRFQVSKQKFSCCSNSFKCGPFQAPQPSEKWQGVRDATYFDKLCFQQTNVTGNAETEDCLYLHVYTPEVNCSVKFECSSVKSLL